MIVTEILSGNFCTFRMSSQNQSEDLDSSGVEPDVLAEKVRDVNLDETVDSEVMADALRDGGAFSCE